VGDADTVGVAVAVAVGVALTDGFAAGLGVAVGVCVGGAVGVLLGVAAPPISGAPIPLLFSQPLAVNRSELATRTNQ
jgi:hypothetical protein